MIVAALSLSACDSSEERAEEFYQNAVELVEAGDTDRAVIELRNALQLDETHVGARRLLADIALERGEVARGYRQLLAVAELSPDDMGVRSRLAELAILSQNWDEAERHGEILLASAEADENKTIDLALRFRRATVDRDEPLLRELITEAEALYAQDQTNEIIQRLLIDGYVRNQEIDSALDVLRTAVEQRPEDRDVWDMQLALIAQQGDLDAVEAHLMAMIERFPGDREIQANMIRTMVAAGRPDDAVSFMRDMIDETEEGLGAQVSLIAFLRQSEGLEAALAETESAIANRTTPSPELSALRSGLLFDSGRREEAIALMEELIGSDAAIAQRNGWKIALARMLQANGNEVGARTRVEEVLAEDPTMVEAIKMQAEWQIERDRVDEAIAALRQALDQAPDDPQLLTLLSQAHARAGDTELAEETLALSVEASQYAVAPSLNYAQRLLGQEQYRAAEDILINSLRRNGNNVAIFNLLGDLYVQEEDFARAEGVERSLRDMGTDESIQIADNLKLRILGRREGRDAAVAYLEGLVAESENDTAALIALIRARLAAGDGEEALRLAEKFDSENDGVEGTLVLAAAQLATGNLEDAEASFKTVVEAAPENQRAWTQLIRVQNALGRPDDAEASMERGLEANPGAPDLLWAKASIAETKNQIDEALAIYEELYEQMPSSVIVANNFGSLLATYRDDPESLERAYAVTRRLRGTEIPPFADTYGWIVFRRGDAEEALPYLEKAAEGLPNDPIVQYHLGQVLEALGRSEEASAAYARAVEVAAEDDPREQVAYARNFLEQKPVVE
jgi:predicted Zn-dependent protease